MPVASPVPTVLNVSGLDQLSPLGEAQVSGVEEPWDRSSWTGGAVGGSLDLSPQLLEFLPLVREPGTLGHETEEGRKLFETQKAVLSRVG